jgi:hypothetical protein
MPAGNNDTFAFFGSSIANGSETTDIRVGSWRELIDSLYDIPQTQFGRHRSNFVYRGLADQSWDLKTSLMRLGGSYIVNQGAIMSIMPGPDLTLSDLLRDYPNLYRRIIISRELKWEVRDKLNQDNVTERMLFPGLACLSTWLKRYYGPGPGQRPAGGTVPPTPSPTAST